jgi:hypothetical protein
MTTYEVDYEGMPEEAKKVKALNDCRDYLGDEHFQRLVVECRKEARQGVMVFSLIGIEGYPARALQEYIWGPGPKDQED